MRYITVLILLFLGCGGGNSTTTTSKEYVDVFTIAPVKNLLITDANGQIAKYDTKENRYYFEKSITYPITATTTEESYVDIDYDNTPTQNDIKPIFTQLQSFNNQINFLTDYYYKALSSEENLTTTDYIYRVSIKYNFNPSNSPLTDPNYAKALIATYDYAVNNNLTYLDDLDRPLEYVAKIDQFENSYLNFLDDDLDKLKYYSFYDSLKLLDKKLIKRIDSLQKPYIISLVRNTLPITAQNSDIDVFDILPLTNAVYTASGQDELSLLSQPNLSLIQVSNTPDEGFGRSLYSQTYKGNSCLFLADSNNIAVYDITNPLTTMYTGTISTYEPNIPYTLMNILNVNGYTSTQESKRLLAIATQDNGMYLLNAKNFLKNCNILRDANSSDILIPATGNTAVSTAFRDDGTYLFVSQVSSIDGYDISTLDPNVIAATKLSTTPQNSEEVYNLLLVNHNSQLFASTNAGIQLYSVDNANNLEFVNEYTSEGAVSGYYPQMVSYLNYLIFTDGYKGIKVLRYDAAFKPMLCGVEYFASKDDSTQLAKVNSVKMLDGYLYVGVDSLGIVKFKFEDILFKHCKLQGY